MNRQDHEEKDRIGETENEPASIDFSSSCNAALMDSWPDEISFEDARRLARSLRRPREAGSLGSIRPCFSADPSEKAPSPASRNRIDLALCFYSAALAWLATAAILYWVQGPETGARIFLDCLAFVATALGTFAVSMILFYVVVAACARLLQALGKSVVKERNEEAR